MANTLRFKRGLTAGLPASVAGEPLFTTDTFDLYIGNGTTNTRFQKYIASGTTAQYLRGDGSLATFPTNIVTGTGVSGQVAYWSGTNTQVGSNNLFWDNTNGRLGIGTATPTDSYGYGRALDIRSTTGAVIYLRDSDTPTTNFGFIGYEASGLNLGVNDATNMIFYTSVAERMRINSSGNVGIGTSGPSQKLHVIGAILNTAGFVLNRSDNYGFFTGASDDLGFYHDGTNSFISNATGALIFNNPSERMRLDASGNLGLGVTPSAWRATEKAIQIGAYTSITNVEQYSAFRNNNYVNSSNQEIYSNSSFRASVYYQYNGTHVFLTAPVGTAGAVATFTQPMTLTANGRLLLGTTIEQTYRLAVAGDVKFDADAATNGFYWDNTNKRLAIGTNSPETNFHIFSLSNSTNSRDAQLRIGGSDGGDNNRFLGIGLFQGSSIATSYAFVQGTTSANYSNEPIKLVLNPQGGSVGIGTTSLTGFTLRVSKNITGAATSYGVRSDGIIQSDVSGQAIGFDSSLGTQAAAFTLPVLTHYRADQSTFGAGSTITTQYGFQVRSNLIGATNNYGFFGDIASGTGRWNLYMNGTAANYFAGELYVGGTTAYGATITSYASAGRSGGIGIRNSAGTVAGAFSSYAAGSGSGSTDILIDSAGFISFATAGTEKMKLFGATGNLSIGSVTPDTGEKLQVTGTMKVTGASTFGENITISKNQNAGTELIVSNTSNTTSAQSRVTITSNGGNGQIAKLSSVYTPYKILNSSDFYLYNATAGDISLLNDFASGSIKMAAGGSSTAHLTIASTGAATFSSSVTTGSFITVTRNQDANVTTFNATAGVTPISAFVINTDQPNTRSILMARNGYSLILGTQDVNRVTIDTTGAATFTSSIEAATAIAIGTTPDTNKPFKILKNINATVGINFENTSTGSSAFSAIQMGTDVTGGTAFTNLVYGSSGISEAGVYKPSGTSLVNTGSGGLNFLAVSQPIRFFTSSGNGTLRASITNDGDYTQFNGTNPSASTTDAFRMYSADVVAGNAAPHFRTENGAVIKLYQETTGVGNAIFSAGGGTGVLDDSTFDGYTLRQIVKALRNQGILA